jgi:hypothetical protein
VQAYHKGFDIEHTKHVTDMDPAKITTEVRAVQQAFRAVWSGVEQLGGRSEPL